MEFKSKAMPRPSQGQSKFGERLVVPNQTLSLEEILERFTRGEPVAVGRQVSYHESQDDLEKISHMDMVDREEYVDRLKETQENYKKQEKRKEAARLKKLQDEALEKAKAELASQAKKAE